MKRLALPYRAAVLFALLVVCASIAPGPATLHVHGAESTDAQRIALYPTVKAPQGAVQGYLITSTVHSMVEGGERFAAEAGEFEENTFAVAVFARYTVLKPDPAGEGRLGVEAVALDPVTFRPLALPRWEGVLRLAPSDVVWEGGATATWASELGVSLDWLREWMTPPADAPSGPIGVGERWQSVANLEGEPRFEEMEFGLGELTVAGEYQEILRPEPGGPAVASIVERYAGRLLSSAERIEPEPWCFEEMDESAGADEFMRWIDECLNAVVAAVLPTGMDVEGVHQLLLVPGDFPWGGRSALKGTMLFEVDDAPRMTLEFTSEVVRHEGGFEQGDILSLAPGEHRTAVLDADTGSWAGTMYGVPAGAPAHVYAFLGEMGEGARVEMSSAAFEPHLVLMDSNWNVIDESFGAADGERAEVFAFLPYSGTYLVQATTSSGWVSGEYTIALEVGPDVAGPAYPDEDGWWEWDDEFGEFDWDLFGEFDWDFDWDPEMEFGWELEGDDWEAWGFDEEGEWESE